MRILTFNNEIFFGLISLTILMFFEKNIYLKFFVNIICRENYLILLVMPGKKFHTRSCLIMYDWGMIVYDPGMTLDGSLISTPASTSRLDIQWMERVDKKLENIQTKIQTNSEQISEFEEQLETLKQHLVASESSAMACNRDPVNI